MSNRNDALTFLAVGVLLLVIIVLVWAGGR